METSSPELVSKNLASDQVEVALVQTISRTTVLKGTSDSKEEEEEEPLFPPQPKLSDYYVRFLLFPENAYPPASIQVILTNRTD